jgi:hypothetical protein
MTVEVRDLVFKIDFFFFFRNVWGSVKAVVPKPIILCASLKTSFLKKINK